MKKLPEETAADRIDAAARAAAGAIGGALVDGTVAAVTVAASLAYAMGFLAAPMQRSRDTWFVEFAAALKDLEKRVGTLEDLENNDAFLDVVFAAIPIALRDISGRKRKALRNVIVNAGLLAGPGQARQGVFVRLIDSLSAFHLDLFILLADPADWFANRNREVPRHRGPTGVGFDVTQSAARLDRVVKAAFPEHEGQDEFLDYVARDLGRQGLLAKDNLFAAHWDPSSNLTFLTPLGREFLRFIGDPPAPASAFDT